MKNIIKLILMAALSTSPAWSDSEANDKSPDKSPAKPALIISPFTLKDSDGKMEVRMDDVGKMFVNGEHVGTVHPEGKLTSLDGKLLLKLNKKGIVETSKGETGKDPFEITEDGTLKQGGASAKWADGKLVAVDPKDGPLEPQLTIEPKDTPATRAAIFCLVATWWVEPALEPAEPVEPKK